jgi:hypothetical protein
VLFPSKADRDAYKRETGIKLVPFWGVSSTNEMILFADKPIPASVFPKERVIVEGVFRKRVDYVEDAPAGITDLNHFAAADSEGAK